MRPKRAATKRPTMTRPSPAAQRPASWPVSLPFPRGPHEAWPGLPPARAPIFSSLPACAPLLLLPGTREPGLRDAVSRASMAPHGPQACFSCWLAFSSFFPARRGPSLLQLSFPSNVASRLACFSSPIFSADFPLLPPHALGHYFGRKTSCLQPSHVIVETTMVLFQD